MEVKASYGMGANVSLGMGLLMLDEMSIQRHKVMQLSPFTYTFSVLVLHKKPVLEVSRQMEMCSTNMKDLSHSTPLHAPESEFVNV
jgi:hypothetical protein